MKVTIVQMAVGPDLRHNTNVISDVVKNSSRDEWVIFPEGVLSGYSPADDTYLRDVDPHAIETAIAELDHVVRETGCHAILGSAIHGPAGWTNSVLSLHPDGPGPRYDKIDLSALDRRHFTPGRSTPVQHSGGVRFGTLGCRELLFPARWAELKAQGAQIVFHLNNAIQPQDARWDALFVARALENSFFVCTVNNSAPPQSLASYLVAPTGQVLAETEPLRQHTLSTEIDLSTVIADLATRTDY